jgi:outer membrane protein assembly factor BamE (lipoprotein component of BamABCDE complex)
MKRTCSPLALGAVALVALVAGCHQPVDQRGNLPTVSQLREVKLGVTD